MAERSPSSPSGTRDLPTPRSFYRSWGWTKRDSGDDEFAQFDAGGVRLALYPLGLLRDEAAPDSELPPKDAWNGVTLAINVADLFAVLLAAPSVTSATGWPVRPGGDDSKAAPAPATTSDKPPESYDRHELGSVDEIPEATAFVGQS